MDALLVILGVLLGAVLVWLPVNLCLQFWKMDKEIEYLQGQQKESRGQGEQ